MGTLIMLPYRIDVRIKDENALGLINAIIVIGSAFTLLNHNIEFLFFFMNLKLFKACFCFL